MRYYIYSTRKEKKRRNRIILLTILAFVALYYLIIKGEISKIKIFPKAKLEIFKKAEIMLKEADKETDPDEKKIKLQKVIKYINKYSSEKELEPYFFLIKAKVFYRKSLLTEIKNMQHFYLDKAIFYYRRALALLPEDKISCQIYREIGKCYFLKGEYYYYESLIHLKEALKRGCGDEQTIKLINIISFIKEGKVEPDIENLRKKIKLTKLEELVYGGYKLKQKGELEKARKMLEEAIKLKDSINLNNENKELLYKAFYGLGWLYYNFKNYRKAIENYNKALKYKKRAEVYYWLGKVYESKKEHRKAIKMWKECLNLDPYYKPAYQKLRRRRR